MNLKQANQLTDLAVNKGSHTMNPLRRLVLLTALATGACLVFAGPVAAATPWWGISSGARPAYIDPAHGQPGTPQVQELIVTGEEFAGHQDQAIIELSVGTTNLEFFFTEPTAAEFGAAPLTAAGLEAALEGPYAPGNVSVTEVPPASLHFQIESPAGSAPLNVGEAVAGSAQTTITNPGTPEVPDGEIYLTVENLGYQSVAGSSVPVKIADTLPPGLEATGIAATQPGQEGEVTRRSPISCKLATLTCTLGREGLAPPFRDALAPYDGLEVRIGVNVKAGAVSGELNQATVSGGEGFTCAAVAPGTGAYKDVGCMNENAGEGDFERSATGPVAPASVSRPVPLGTSVPFGVESYELRNEEEGGGAVNLAGSHPFQQTTTIFLNQTADGRPLENTTHKPAVNPVALPKDVHFIWPPGLLGNPQALPKCSDTDFYRSVSSGGATACPANTAIGVAFVTVNEPSFAEVAQLTVPLFNMEPRYGEPARFGFNVIAANAPVVIDTSLRSDGDYGVTVESNNITQTAAFLSASVTLWGSPGDPRHNGQRGWGCLFEGRGGQLEDPVLPCAATATFPNANPTPFLQTQTTCNSDAASQILGDTWVDPLAPADFPTLASYQLSQLEGCNQIPFDPHIHSEPTSDSATSPTGLAFDLGFEDEGLNNAGGRVESQLKKAVVTLPQGFTTNPSVAEGLKACDEAEYLASTVASDSGCNPESKVGEVEIESPLLPPSQIVKGGVFVARQGQNPNHNLLSLYMVASNAEAGVLIKQVLKVVPDPVTGQLTTEVDNVPQAPFSHFHLFFRSGQRAPLITPPACGTYAVTADLYPWARPDEPVHRESSFQITSGPEGQGCPSGGTPPFHPGLEAGTQNPSAGRFSPFYTHLTRKDSEQEITRFSIKLPPGVIGKLAGVSSCSDAQVAAAKAREHEGGGTEEENSPSCPANSEIGHSLVGSGVGNVLAYAPGKLYLAGPYHGSNLSIVSITAAKVGPFDLGTVVVRFALRIDPETAEVFVDSQGSDPIPHIVDGIPVHLRDIRAYVDRPNFTLNPTSCAKKSTASTVLGSGLNFASEADDQPVTVTSPFQAADCASLGFAPKLGLSLKGGTKRGATPAFKAVLTYPKGSYANIAKSVVTLPHSEFLEQAHIKTICTRVQFKEGKVPGEKCPKASIYGRAEAVTPLLDEPLKGPVYLRSSSHNLPDLVAALHNNQVDFALAGRIDSVRNGRIRNTFETVPDAPVSKFVLEMQGGKKGLLVNSTNLCKQKNRAISEFTGQNGKLYNTKPVLQAKCGKAKKHKGKGKK